MEIEDLKAAWREMSDQVAAQRKLTDKLILAAIHRKSMDTSEELRSGLAFALLTSSVAFLLPLFWAWRSNDGAVTAGALVILALALVNTSVTWRVYRALGEGQDGVKSVRETVQNKLRRIHAYFSWSRSYGLLVSILIFVSGVATYLTFRYGYVRVTTIDLIVYASLAVVWIVLTFAMTRRHEASIAGTLERCLEELDGMEPGAASSSRPLDLLGLLFAFSVVALSVAVLLLTWNQAAR